MSAQIVFLALFLGLTSGAVPLSLHVDGPVKLVRVTLDGRQLATLRPPRWEGTADIGPLLPGELVATGYDEEGNEVARASQILNLSRARAEFDIILESEAKRLTAAALRWRHVMNIQPKSATISVDGSPLTVGPDFRAALPALDPRIPHVIAAEMRFEDDFVCRRELVIEGSRSDSVGTQLTPILLTRTSREQPKSYDGCIAAGGTALRVNAVEKPAARVVIVQDPFPGDSVRAVDPHGEAQFTFGLRYTASLASDTSVRIVWPIARRYSDSESISTLFERTSDMPSQNGGLPWFLTVRFNDPSRFHDLRHYADAVAVAGLGALDEGLRRAVVLVLGDHTDVSHYSPAAARRYLSAIGVPLFVWSLTGPRPDLADSWGEVEDISSLGKLQRATSRLRGVLDAQRVAWVGADPLTALRAEVKSSCGVAPVAVP